jgi:EAL domain-containing protein (putative c-di-GMP-specific phosphodiesterase class I)
LIVPLGKWVLGEACRQATAWQQPNGAPIGIAVNLSGRQVYDVGLVDDVAAALRNAGLDASLLTLEITESVLLRDVDVVTARLRALKALGVRLAIDDFGTGYSSLGYLRQFPVDVLKIDRSFVSGVDSGSAERAVVRSIVSLSEVLGFQTVAEGIEDESQLAVLRSLGTQQGQGFLFAEPLEADLVRDAISGAKPISRRGVTTRRTGREMRTSRPSRTRADSPARATLR